MFARRALRRRALWSGLPAARFDAVDPAAFPSASIIIPAHNVLSVIARTLAPLASLAASGALEVIVACNGCSDDTAAIAGRFAGVTVIELAEPSRAAALNAGDEVATRWPRLYQDADIEVDPAALAAAIRALAGDGIFAADRRSVSMQPEPPSRFGATSAHAIGCRPRHRPFGAPACTASAAPATSGSGRSRGHRRQPAR